MKIAMPHLGLSRAADRGRGGSRAAGCYADARPAGRDRDNDGLHRFEFVRGRLSLCGRDRQPRRLSQRGQFRQRHAAVRGPTARQFARRQGPVIRRVFVSYARARARTPTRRPRLRVEKNALYRYDMQFRIVNYFNRLPSLWQGEHGINSERIFADPRTDFVPGKRVESGSRLRPQQPQRSRLFFRKHRHESRSHSSASHFLRFTTNLRQLNNQYRVGLECSRVAGWCVSFLQGFDNYARTRFTATRRTCRRRSQTFSRSITCSGPSRSTATRRSPPW